MIAAVLGSLGAKLAERWVSLIVVPGLLYVAVAAAAPILGHRHWFDVSLVRDRIDEVSGRPGLSTAGGIILTMGAVLAASGAAGLTARLLGALTLRGWLGAWAPLPRGLARRGTARRLRRWQALQAGVESAALAHPPLEEAARESARERNRISAAPPRRPTWMGDRLAAVETRVATAYGLDLVSSWPRLWLVVPENNRLDLTAARGTVDSSATLAGWAVLYLALGAVWWPAAVIGAATWLVAYRAGRNAVGTYADLTESVLDLHAPTLARSIGLECPATMTPAIGREVTRRLRKGS